VSFLESAKLGRALKQYRISNTWSEIVWLVSEQSKNYRTLSWITPESEFQTRIFALVFLFKTST